MKDFRVTLESPFSFKNKRILFVSPHPDDDVIGCGGMLYYLSLLNNISLNNISIDIAYAVSGFVGVSEKFALNSRFSKDTIKDSRYIRTCIRKEEASSCCQFLGVNQTFCELPFYEKRVKEFDDKDLDIVLNIIKKKKPDIIFFADEGSDPHGTHGVVKSVLYNALKKTNFSGILLGYRVWEDRCYSKSECDVTISFDKDFMDSKKSLISFHQSQIIDPAFPCKDGSFLDLVERSNSETAKRLGLKYNYAETFKICSLQD